MKILVFGDIHGNLISLEKLFHLERNSFDTFVCHGDIVNYGPWSNECIQFLLQQNGTILKGNHEEYFLNGNYPGTNEVAKTFFHFCYPKLDSKFLNIIENIEEQCRIDVYSFKHSIENRYIFKDTDINSLDFEDNTIIGHSHQQFHIISKGKNLFNTGSLGQNRAFLNVANYLIIDTAKMKVEMKYFLYNIDTVISEMQHQKYPEICLNYYRSKKILYD